MYSLRRRLTLALTAGFGVLLIVAGVSLERRFTSRILVDFDASLVSTSRVLSILARRHGDRVELDYAGELMPEFEQSEEPDYFQLWLPDGSVLERSERLGSRNLARFDSTSSRPIAWDVVLPDGRPGRSIELAFVPQSVDGEDDPPPLQGAEQAAASVILVVARGRGAVDEEIREMRLIFAGTVLATGALAAFLVWRILLVGFRPLARVASQVGLLEAHSLGNRIDPEGLPGELIPVVRQLNAALGRLSEAFARERRFTGNVAHELRTPIAELRSLAEIGCAWPEDAEWNVRFFEDVRDVTLRMERTVVDILLLARCQSGVEPVDSCPVDCVSLLREIQGRCAETLEARQLELDLECAGDTVVHTDPGKLDIAIGNLFDNAASHALPGTVVRCSARVVDGLFRFELENAASPLSDSDLARVADPFWRADAARASTEHAGLGLSLVVAIADLLGMTVEFRQDAGQRFRVTLSGPSGEAPSS